MKALAGLAAGIIFGFGLALSGMTDRDKVLGFLDIFGQWQPALLLVMGSAVVMTLLGFAAVSHQAKPFFSHRFYLAATRPIDAKLLGGAALFGIGWGVYGFCPGPAIASMFYGNTDTYYFVVAMIAGMWIASSLEARFDNT